MVKYAPGTHSVPLGPIECYYIFGIHANIDVQTLVQLYIYIGYFILSLNVEVCMDTKYLVALNRTHWYSMCSGCLHDHRP